jgi:hypothetical protein
MAAGLSRLIGILAFAVTASERRRVQISGRSRVNRWKAFAVFSRVGRIAPKSMA